MSKNRINSLIGYFLIYSTYGKVRIVGGRETGVNEYPMMAGLIDGRLRELFCGATIISPSYALTAAHCLIGKKPKTIGLLVGEHDTSVGKFRKKSLEEEKISQSSGNITTRFSLMRSGLFIKLTMEEKFQQN